MDLEIHREIIAGRLAEADAAEALELLWQLPEFANPTRERCEDYEGNGYLGCHNVAHV